MAAADVGAGLENAGERGMIGKEEHTLYVGKWGWPNEVMLQCFDLGLISNANKCDELHQNEFAHLLLTLTHFLFCYRQFYKFGLVVDPYFHFTDMNQNQKFLY